MGNEFYLEAGVIRGGKFYPKDSDKAEELARCRSQNGPGQTTSRTSSTAVRSRKVEDLNADILEGHLSSACCHLGNISYRLGRQVAGTTRPDVLDKHEEIGKSWERIAETVKGAIGRDLATNTYQLGPMLTFDPQAEKFAGNPQADALLTRPYRKPFIAPDRV